MGRQAKLTASRRKLDAERRAANREMAESDWAQELAGSFWDEGCARLRDRDAAGQRGRLDAAGWICRERNQDGVGVWDQPRLALRIIHSVCREGDGGIWGHVSVSRWSGIMPGWERVRDAGWLLYPGRFGIIVVAPESAHVSLFEVGHVWFRLDGPSCPDFSHGLGTI